MAFEPGFGSPKRGIYSRRSVGLHSVGDVGIQVHRRSDGRVTKALLGDPWGHAVGEQLGGMGVPYVVEAHLRQVVYPVSQKGELMSDTAWLQGFTIGAAARERLARLPNAQRE